MYCGVCASDMSLMSSGWGPADYPIICGHEVVGTVVRVGSEVKHLKVGDLAGVGAQAESCLECDYCRAGEEVCEFGFFCLL
jgi:alcohol dehydrogenase (NADP+)